MDTLAVKLLTLDFETYFDQDYSLTKMTTEDYVYDPRFQIIGCSLRVGTDDGVQARFIPGPLVHQVLQKVEFSSLAVLCQNTTFDGLILTRLNLPAPKLWLDTKSMGKALYGQHLQRCGLKEMLEHTGLPFVKGNATSWAKGLRYEHFTPTQLSEYGAYCCNDTDSTLALFKRMMASGFPASELLTIDQTIRMYLEPRFLLDTELLEDVVRAEVEKSEARAAAVAKLAPPSVLRSNDQFAELLKGLGLEVPLKPSPTEETKMIPALAKNDPAWKDLKAEHANDALLTALFEAREGSKSRIEETRARKLLAIGQRYGFMRVALNYHSAHTSRYGGGEGLNQQNLPSTRKGSRIRHSIVAPPGSMILAADLAQIEARITAWLAGELQLLEDFRSGRSPYSSMAADIYGRPINKEKDKLEYKLGKEIILGCGFGMSGKKFRWRARNEDIVLTLEQANEYVTMYRKKYKNIPKLWRKCEQLIQSIAFGSGEQFGPVTVGHEHILLPDGLKLYYPKLRRGEDGWEYWAKGSYWKKLWGGALTENLAQSLAQRLLVHFAHEIRRRLGLSYKLQVHDELVYVVPEADATRLAKEVESIMSVAAPWAVGLPVRAEVTVAKTYGDC